MTHYHFSYALLLVVLAAAYAGTTWGLGRVWAQMFYVHWHRRVLRECRSTPTAMQCVR